MFWMRRPYDAAGTKPSVVGPANSFLVPDCIAAPDAAKLKRTEKPTTVLSKVSSTILFELIKDNPLLKIEIKKTLIKEIIIENKRIIFLYLKEFSWNMNLFLFYFIFS